MLDMAEGGRHGTFDTVSRPGHTTMGELLELSREVVAAPLVAPRRAAHLTGDGHRAGPADIPSKDPGGQAKLCWVDPDVIEQAGIAPWTELPIWLPPTGPEAGLHGGDTSKALAAGLLPVSGRDGGGHLGLARHRGRPEVASQGAIGLDRANEATLLAAV
jgi:2'-hydroxyisoflavone reductase